MLKPISELDYELYRIAVSKFLVKNDIAGAFSAFVVDFLLDECKFSANEVRLFLERMKDVTTTTTKENS